MSEPQPCPKCGAPLPDDAPQGLCPKCLLRRGLEETAAEFGARPVAGSMPPIRYFGDYELESEIARGGMGVVYKARQVTLNRPVAVKMILAGQLADEVAVDRFYAEAEAAANLNHPNIVAIHEVGRHEGQHYFSMDFIAGRNLAEWAAGRPVAAVQAAALVGTIAEAIHYAHQRGTLHRDLKPSNVLVDAKDEPHVTDFGLAKTMGSERGLTQTGDIMGTPDYMAPEQASGRHDRIGPHTDVYALGAILYELLTGHPPLQAANPMEALLKVIEADPVAPRARNATIPLDLETICLKCLEKSPQRRYASARELAEDLDRFLRHEPVHARQASVIRKSASWARRHPGVLAAAAALAVFGLIAGVFYLAEENAFLRAQHADPALTRQPGPRSAALGMWNDVALVLSLPGFCLCMWFAWRAQGWRNTSDPNRWNQPLQPVDRRLRAAAACLGIATACISLVVLAKSLEALVWEASPGLVVTATAVYTPGLVGLWLLALVVRDYRLAAFGRPALSQEQKSAIQRKLVEAGRLPTIKLYREALRNAGLAEAMAYVEQLESEWRQRDPQGFSERASKPRELNWRLTAICAGIEAAMLGVVWLTIPAVRAQGLSFAEGFALGLILTATPRLKASTRRFKTAYFVLGTAGFFLFGVLEYSFDASPSGSLGSYVLGMLCCAALLISGYTPRRTVQRQLV